MDDMEKLKADRQALTDIGKRWGGEVEFLAGRIIRYFNRLEKEHASQKGKQSGDDQSQHRGDDQGGTSAESGGGSSPAHCAPEGWSVLEENCADWQE